MTKHHKIVDDKVSAVSFLGVAYFIFWLIVVFASSLNNSGNRKYIPVKPSISERECKKAFVNVNALSPNEKYAVICCDDETISNASPYFGWLFDSYESAICAGKPDRLPFAGKLTTIAGSWVLPAFIILAKFLVICVKKVLDGRFSDWESARATFYRLGFYFVVMNFRGWILFVLLNKLQDMLRPGNLLDSCWYDDYMIRRTNRNSNCYGQGFDFSDHTVLFLCQIIPVLSCEFFVSLLSPIRSNMNTNGFEKLQTEVDIKNSVLQTANVCYFVYINIIVFLAMYKTAAYFHTPSEVAVGYIISLLVQLPFGFLIFFDSWASARKLTGIRIISDLSRYID